MRLEPGALGIAVHVGLVIAAEINHPHDMLLLQGFAQAFVGRALEHEDSGRDLHRAGDDGLRRLEEQGGQEQDGQHGSLRATRAGRRPGGMSTDPG
ncbi:hypothetical protein GALL_544330 [mine drainage metagenome]|uniref:Uncharacterized protein n=1 Tax=mine drainage metagenome TaxID=410659 RepID=A0A1J5PKG2_9ZZZZ